MSRLSEYIRLHPQWSEAWNWMSTWIVAILTAAPVLYTYWQPLQAYLPARWFAAGMLCIGVLGILNIVRLKRGPS